MQLSKDERIPTRRLRSSHLRPPPLRSFSYYYLTASVLLLVLVVLLPSVPLVVATESINDLLQLEYPSHRIFPHRTKEEAAVLEWGHSAIITALDASVAHFGPQTSQAALLEVEAMPLLAEPLTGERKPSSSSTSDSNGDSSATTKLSILDNAEEAHGNLVVMTNQNNLTGVEMALLAQASGAAALLVVNVNQEHPEEIYRLPALDGHEQVQIPVVMISLNSANALTTATITATTKQHEIVNNGMPERVRLYAGGDRPFFEDMEAQEPMAYLIHNLLTEAECQSLIRRAQPRLTPITENDALQLTMETWRRHNVERVLLWQGLLQGPAAKQIEERIEQVTGFPTDHYSDFIVDKYEPGSHWLSHYDTMAGGDVPLATITIFLNEPDGGGGQLVFPSTSASHPLQIKPTPGMAIVHHNTDDEQQFDVNAVHAQLPPVSGTLYVATKYVFAQPSSKLARRVVLPLLAWPWGGSLPRVVVQGHDWFVKQFGYEQGGAYFDKACVFVPMLLVLLLVQWTVDYAAQQWRGKDAPASKSNVSSASKAPPPPTAAAKEAKRSKTDKKKN